MFDKRSRLTILDSRVTASTRESDLGSIDWLKFEGEFKVPCGFAANKASEIVLDTKPCSVAAGKRE